MSGAVDVPPAVATRLRAKRRTPEYASRRVTFKDLAEARFDYESARGKGLDAPRTIEVRDCYERALSDFERREGEIVHEFWASFSQTALVVTTRGGSRIKRFFGAGTSYRLHRSSELAALPRELEQALADGDIVASKAADVLSAGAAETVIDRVFEAQRFLLTVANGECKLDEHWVETIRHELGYQEGVAEPEEASPVMPREAASASPEPRTPGVRARQRRKGSGDGLSGPEGRLP